MKNNLTLNDSEDLLKERQWILNASENGIFPTYSRVSPSAIEPATTKCYFIVLPQINEYTLTVNLS